jgi:hypothetical protein
MHVCPTTNSINYKSSQTSESPLFDSMKTTLLLTISRPLSHRTTNKVRTFLFSLWTRKTNTKRWGGDRCGTKRGKGGEWVLKVCINTVTLHHRNCHLWSLRALKQQKAGTTPLLKTNSTRHNLTSNNSRKACIKLLSLSRTFLQWWTWTTILRFTPNKPIYSNFNSSNNSSFSS